METVTDDEWTFDEAVNMLRELNLKQKKLGYNTGFEMDGFIEPTEWSDEIFLKHFWNPLPAYKRPDRSQISAASKYFLFHYTSGTGTIEDWEKTLRTLLLALRSKSCWILANGKGKIKNEFIVPPPLPIISDEQLNRVLGNQRVQRPKRRNRWYRWCLSQFIRQPGTSEDESMKRENILHTYLGYLSLCFISLITQQSHVVQKQIIENATRHMNEIFGYIVNDGGATVPPDRELWPILEKVFKRHHSFSIEIVTRLAKRRMEIGRNNHNRSLIEKVQNEACYISISNQGLELVTWFFSAAKKSQLEERIFLDIVSLLRFGLDVNVDSISNILPRICVGGKEEHTWSISRLLSESAHCNYSIWCPYNFLTIAFFVAIATGSQQKSDKIWTQENLKPISKYPEVLDGGIKLSKRFSDILNKIESFNKKETA